MRNRAVLCLLLAWAAHVCGAAEVLVYDAGGGEIQSTLAWLGIAYDLRNAGNPVTGADLASHEALVIGWNAWGDVSGVGPLETGITGNILLTGHDPDYHGPYGEGAAAFLSQAITFAQSGSGTGLVALGDYTSAFAYLPASWGISATGGLSEDEITAFTSAGLASGIFDGLTVADMSYWYDSYHATFNRWGTSFAPFEMSGTTVVTIGGGVPAAVPVSGAVLLGALGVGGIGWLRYRRTL